jgi:hypothetical protein
LSEIEAVLAVGREVDGITCAFQRRSELAAKIGLVFDDQDPHLIPL